MADHYLDNLSDNVQINTNTETIEIIDLILVIKFHPA